MLTYYSQWIVSMLAYYSQWIVSMLAYYSQWIVSMLAYYLQWIAELNLSDVVKQILQTSRGTEFYLLPDAGLTSAESVEGQDEDNLQSEDKTNDAIINMIIPKSLILQTKLKIRQNFLEHLDEWFDEASDRANSIVIAKCQEINSELDLRLHLHQPRPQRAEFDIHNVRAAELVMHSERVIRHCAGMEKKMAELSATFKAMNMEHNKLANQFHVDIQALEVKFVNATKSSRLVNLQNQLVVEKEKFMTTIRTSLRQFRQHLDETLQMLRESNARFIKAFKLFSDGGNFCPEEIEDYRKKLEKMSQQIDSTEGSIMSELEGMESKRLESATKICLEFEERFKSHMNDLVFMERVSRWLTNTQVKIKSEVAYSNTQSQNLLGMLKTLEQRINACQNKNMDLEQITSTQLNDSLEEIFGAFVKRWDYLQREKTGTGPNGTIANAKVVFTNDNTAQAGKISKLIEDPTFATIKSILKTQRTKLKFGLDAAIDGEEYKREKSAVSQSSSKGSEQSMTKINQKANIDVKKTAIGTVRSSKQFKIDKKPLSLGIDTSSKEQFIPHIQGILKDTSDGLLSTAEVFYAQKGSNPVTRPQVLQETLEQFTEVITQKIGSYGSQADDYHNQCLQEFRHQLLNLEDLCAQVPGLVIGDYVQNQILESKKAHDALVSEFQSILEQLATRQTANKKELRPTLGHPNLKDDLAALCAMEYERHLNFVEHVTRFTETQQENAVKNGQVFVEGLVELSTRLLKQCDHILLLDEVDKGRVEPKLLPTSELIRRKKAGKSLEEEETNYKSSCSIASWIGLPMNQFCLEGLPSRLELSPSITTNKTTSAHSAVIKSRDLAYQTYKTSFDKMVQEIESTKNSLLLTETLWSQSWNSSVEKVKGLYQTES
ncbi:hypothetical protein Bpfe_006994 [Biomphalaria pfeifferi]|uniref:DUF4456 domain-containing protein n=1 Tax=Biomphalaria pfeifferi TaxID=112525 RepID=A0AAD8C058_BIOPF|nr:hypothetical protein Bpfe_006994 [Biomphalaria pfeifferi]